MMDLSRHQKNLFNLVGGGALQGDPLGPLLFSLAMRRVWAETLRECSPRAWGAFYLDDGVLAGNVAAVRSTFDAFRTACSRHGLRINMDKCVVAAPERWADEARRSFPEFAFHDELEILGAPCRSRAGSCRSSGARASHSADSLPLAVQKSRCAAQSRLRSQS